MGPHDLLMNLMTGAPSEDPDQPAQAHSMIGVLLHVLPVDNETRLSYCLGAQAVLSEVTFSCPGSTIFSKFCKIAAVSKLHKSIVGRCRPVREADGPVTAHYRFM